MEKGISIQNQRNNSILNFADDAKYLMLLCNEQPNIVIKTEYGLGKFKFIKFGELQGNLVLEFNLLNDENYKDTNSICSHIGNTCFLSIPQYLYLYNSAFA